jgi:hypothetical protein
MVSVSAAARSRLADSPNIATAAANAPTPKTLLSSVLMAALRFEELDSRRGELAWPRAV